MKPRIGITLNFIMDDQFGVSAHIGGIGQHWHAVADDYIQAVVQAGGLPVLLPILPQPELAKLYLQQVDGMIFSGGCDVSPLLYGEDTQAKVGQICPQRDTQELLLMQEALRQENFPVLGICRGCQLFNVALGGTLVQDMDTSHTGAHFFPEQRMSTLTHTVSTKAGSKISTLLGKQAKVNSYHHQCVSKLGDGVVMTAWDAHGVPECLELPNRGGFTMGVQWHPEGLAGIYPEHQAIFQALVQAAQSRKEDR